MLLSSMGATADQATQQTLDALRAQMEAMQQQIERLEREQQAANQRQAEAEESIVSRGTLPNSFRVGDTSFQIGGYVKLDAIYDLNQDMGDTLFAEGIDTSDSESDASFRAHARQSRLYFKTSTPTPLGDATTHIEGDFFGGGGNEVFTNGRGFRLRHAYGTLGGFLAGQTWSNFMHFTAYPTTVDFDGPVGVSFIRQAQIRYTMPVGDGDLSVALENPEATGFDNASDTMPDFTARYQWSGERAGLETAAVVRRFEVDDDASLDDSTLGYGLMLAGNLQVGDNTTLMAGAIYGDGIGRYLYTASGNSAGTSGIGGAFVDGSGNLETIEAYGLNAAVVQQWTPAFSSSLSYGRVRGDRDLAPESTRLLQSVHFSHFYQVTDPVLLGFEVSWADKQLQNRESEDNTRLQFSAQYSF